MHAPLCPALFNVTLELILKDTLGLPMASQGPLSVSSVLSERKDVTHGSLRGVTLT